MFHLKSAKPLLQKEFSLLLSRTSFLLGKRVQEGAAALAWFMS